MIIVSVFCVLSGLTFVIASLRPHPGSEAGSLTGGSRVLVQVMGIATGVFTIAIGLFAGDPGALLGIFLTFAVLYGIVAVVLILAVLVSALGRVGRDDHREPGLGPHEPPPNIIYYR
jgi:hypothetical protein